MRNAAIRLACFVAVGCAAALTHLGVVVLWSAGMAAAAGGERDRLAGRVHRLLCRPLAAHVPLAAGAFVAAAGRFFGVSAAGFATNESHTPCCCNGSSWRYDVVLALVLVGVAVITYLLSSRWAFGAACSTEAPARPAGHAPQHRACCCARSRSASSQGRFQRHLGVVAHHPCVVALQTVSASSAGDSSTLRGGPEANRCASRSSLLQLSRRDVLDRPSLRRPVPARASARIKGTSK